MVGSTKVGTDQTENIAEESRWTKLSFWLCALHLFTLCGLAFAKPIFDITGKEAAFYVVRGSRPADVLSLIAILCMVIPGTLVLLEALLRLLGRRAQLSLHFLFVGTLASVYSAQFIKPWKELNGYAAVAILITAGICCATLYANTQSFRRLVSFASVFVVIIPVLFVFGSQVGKILLPGGFTWTDVNNKSTHVYLKKKPPIVFVVMDEFPIVSILDAKGEIDAKRFPNLAAFAATSHWYRNTTSVSPTTETAVPAILTGIFPKQKLLPNITDHPDNIFTLLADNYKFNVYESACYLCPQELASKNRQLPPYSTRLRLLIEDVAVVYLHRVLPEPYTAYLPTITNRWGSFIHEEREPAKAHTSTADKILSRKDIADKLLSMKKGDRPDIFRSFISDIDTTRKDTFNFIHILLPHGPFEYLPSTSKYQAVSELGLEGATKTNDKFTGPQGLVDQYHQLHLLQLAAMDRLIGELIAKLRSKGLFDESLIVMVADHGASFKANDFNRELSDTNAADIMFVPLFFKLPGQQKGEVEELDAETIDVVPTIADYLGVQVPWKVSGTSLLSRNRTAKASKMMSATDKVHTYPLSRLLQMRQKTLTDNTKKYGLTQKNSTLFWFGDELDVLGKSVSGFQVKQDKVAIRFEQPHLFQSVDLKQKLFPALIKGELDYHEANNAKIAISVNGIIQGVATPYNINGKNIFTAVIPETAFKQGANKVEGFIISTDINGSKKLISANQKEETFALKGANILSSNGSTYPIFAATLPGLVDDFQVVAKDIAITGWAADLRKTKAADLVVVFVDGKCSIAGRTTEARPDVSTIYKAAKMQTCGFRFLLPPATDTKKIRVFAISDNKACELNYNPRLGLKADYLRTAYSAQQKYKLRDNTILTGETTYTFAPEAFKGSVDSLKKEGNSLVIAGWAANVKKSNSVDSIAVFSKERLIASGETRILRPDIGKIVRSNREAYFGFEYLLPSVKVSEKEELRVFAISDGLATELAIPKKSRLNGPKYAQGDETLISANQGTINVYPNSLQGSLNAVQIKSKKVSLLGWAANANKGLPVEAIVLFNGEEFIGSGKPTLLRPDVGKAFNNQKLAQCGFDFELPSKIRDAKEIRIFAVSGNIAMELNNPFKAKSFNANNLSRDASHFLLAKDRILTDKGGTVLVKAEMLEGSVDLVGRKGDTITVEGWAANTKQPKPAELVLAFYENQLIASAKPRVTRPDVGKAFASEKLDYCGFSLSFASSIADKLSKVRVFAVLDGAATEFSNAALIAEETKAKPATQQATFPNATTNTRLNRQSSSP